MAGAMLGSPARDYTTPQTIKQTGGFGNPATRRERLERLAWALDRVRASLDYLMFHGVSPRAARAGPQDRSSDTPRPGHRMAPGAWSSRSAWRPARRPAELLKRTLQDLQCRT